MTIAQPETVTAGACFCDGTRILAAAARDLSCADCIHVALHSSRRGPTYECNSIKPTARRLVHVSTRSWVERMGSAGISSPLVGGAVSIPWGTPGVAKHWVCGFLPATFEKVAKRI